MIRLMFFAALGLLLGFGVLVLVAPEGTAIWAFPVGLTLSILTGTFWGVARAASPGVAGVSQDIINAARDNNRFALARIDAVRQTGLSINDQPVLELDLTVAPNDRPAFRVSTRRLVPLIRLAEYRPGEKCVVALLTNDGVEVALVDEDAHQPPWDRMRVPESSLAGEVRKPRRGVPKADGTLRGPLLGGSRKGALLRVPLYVLVTLLVAGALVYSHRGSLQLSVQSLQRGDGLHPNLLKPDYAREAVNALSAKAGSPVASEVTLRAGRVDAEVPLAPGKIASDDWFFERGVVERRGPSTIQPRTAGEQFSLSEVAWEKVWRSVQRCADQHQLPLDSAYVRVARTVDSDIESKSFGQNTGPIQVTVSLTGPYGSGSCTTNAKGAGFTAQ